MSTSDNWKQAQASILDPLTGPTPEQETGLNSSFAPTNLPLQSNQSPYSPGSQQNTGATSDSNNPFRRASASETSKNPYTHTREISGGSPGRVQEKGASSHVRQISNGTPEKGASSHVRHISSGSPRRERFPDMDPFSDDPSRRRSVDKGFRADLNQQGGSSGLRRNSSLKERFPGDKSVRPLDILREEEKKASRASHLKKRHIPGADSVDQLDETIGNKYHHEGPYDATLLARNTSFTSSPVAALKTTNEEALRATPSEAVKDSLDKHRPLDNTAAIAPGRKDQFGRRYEYEDGENMTSHLTRYEGVDYKDDDSEGVGEPAFSTEQELRMRGSDRSNVDGDHIELMERVKPAPEVEPHAARASGAYTQDQQAYGDWEREQQSGRKGSLGNTFGSLKKRMSIRKKKDQE